MSVVGLAVAAILFGIGTYLILQRLLSRVIIGLALMSHGANLLIILSAGAGAGAEPPILAEGVDPAVVADPLPQAMVLTAIVISFGVMTFLLALALQSWLLTGSDAVEDDVEDRRVRRQARKSIQPPPDTGMHEDIAQ